VDLPRIIANQQRTFLSLIAQIQPHVRTDSALPRRIKDLLGRNRAFGSRDRRLYRELLYTAIRFLPWAEPLLASKPDQAARLVAWLAPALKDLRDFRAQLCGEWPEPTDSLAGKAGQLTDLIGADFSPETLLPAWFREECPAAFASPHLDALNERAALWVRLQTDRPTMVLEEFTNRGWTPERSAVLPDAVRLPSSAEVAASDAYRRGFCEIQDLGSQLVLHHVPLTAGGNWLDACAGAGGKTLQLARLAGANGHVDATDIRPEMLVELQERAARAKLDNIHVVRTPAAAYDGVLVDAPCSGTGTWRRLPHMKWYTQPPMLAEFATLQGKILAENSARVRPGGLLVYATCSLSHRENHDVVQEFIRQHSEFSPESPAKSWGSTFDGLGSTILPGTHDTDGFYVAVLRKKPTAT
jgi:16S rRNA (cytosine967-C5)-methyltransferase